MAVLWALASVTCPHRAPSSHSSLKTLRSSCPRFHFRAWQSGNDCGGQKILTGKDVENVPFPQTNQRPPVALIPAQALLKPCLYTRHPCHPPLAPAPSGQPAGDPHVGIPVYPSSGNHIHASRLFSSVSHLTPLRGNRHGLS